LGNEVSEQQWLDLISIVKTQSAKLDRIYLSQQAEGLQDSDLLEEAFKALEDA
jgi:hypothetical protein